MDAKNKKNMSAPNTDRSAEEKKKALQAALNQVNKQYGQGAIIKMSESPNTNVEVISTGSLNLDIALGVGGLPRGRIVELYGPEAAGKSTLAMSIVSEAQKAGGVAVYIDAEHAMDTEYARKIGVNVDEMYLVQPSSGEQALDICETMVRSNSVDLIVIDSVAALVPQQEIDGEMGDALVGAHARLLSKACRKLTAAINESRCIVLFINQLREKVGVMYGNPEVTTGGHALKYYSSVRLDIRRVEAIKGKGSEVIGNHVKVKTVKNKVAPPFRVAEFNIIFGKGIARDEEIVDAAVTMEIISKSGAWFFYKDERWQGKERVKEALAANDELRKEIEDAVMKRLHSAKVEPEGGAVEPDVDDEADILDEMSDI